MRLFVMWIQTVSKSPMKDLIQKVPKLKNISIILAHINKLTSNASLGPCGLGTKVEATYKTLDCVDVWAEWSAPNGVITIEDPDEEPPVLGPLPTKMTVEECWSLATNAGLDECTSDSRRIFDKFRVRQRPYKLIDSSVTLFCYLFKDLNYIVTLYIAWKNLLDIDLYTRWVY